MMHYKILRRYTLALYGVAEEAKKLDEVKKDADFIIGMLNESRDLFLFFQSPVINRLKKKSIAKMILGDSISELTMNFINLLIERGRDNLLKFIFEDYLALRNERLGIMNVTVKTAVALDAKEKEAMQKKIDSFIKLKSNPTFEVDNSIIGGFQISYKDTILDASIKSQLDKLKKLYKSGDAELN
ncbi:MAG: ATP synthase F1 subunit delta [Ignavibacteria bacterium]|nr:ATP synthase F1 subunit delta [Ignavibacteria bacterium]